MEVTVTGRVDDRWLKAFGELGGGEAPSKKLSMLLRPTITAPRGKTLVYGDWSAIEARVLPWLAASSGADRVLDVFRTNDADPDLPDIYKITAGELLGKPATEVTKDERQAYGKVPVLSLGFGGGLGALQAMATNYGVYLNNETGLRVVNDWRSANGWARSFWGSHGRDGSYGLWGAINTAIENPDTICPAGRVAYVYDRSYLGGTVFCALPCGRLLTYPSIKWEWREVENKQTKKLEDRYQLTFLKGYGRSALWYGKLAENVTQATAASVLRRTLKRLDRDWMKTKEGGYLRYVEHMPVVMHTHDEVVTQVAEWFADEAGRALKRLMETNDEWDAGLPLAAEVTEHWFYSKNGRKIG